jgi:hypothetical protein
MGSGANLPRGRLLVTTHLIVHPSTHNSLSALHPYIVYRLDEDAGPIKHDLCPFWVLLQLRFIRAT